MISDLALAPLDQAGTQARPKPKHAQALDLTGHHGGHAALVLAAGREIVSQQKQPPQVGGGSPRAIGLAVLNPGGALGGIGNAHSLLSGRWC